MITPKMVRLLAGAAATLALSTSSWAQYSKVVMFGDSMSDTHRWYDFLKATTGKGYPSPPSLTGRFSDGKVAAELLAEGLNAPFQGYSFSGAQSGYGSLVALPMGILTQVNEYLNNNAVVPVVTTIPLISSITGIFGFTGKADPKALHVIWCGPDDYYGLGGYNAMTAFTITSNVQQAITSLYNAGARYFFVPTMPDLSLTPSARYNHEPREPGYMATAAKYSAQFAVELPKGLETMRQRYPKARIMSFDTMAYTNEMLPKLVAQGINITDQCLDAPDLPKPPLGGHVACAEPAKHLFWDTNHLTAVGNRVLADGWIKAITVQP